MAPELTEVQFEAEFDDGVDGTIRVLCDLAKAGFHLLELQLIGDPSSGTHIRYVLRMPNSIDATDVCLRHARHPTVRWVKTVSRDAHLFF